MNHISKLFFITVNKHMLIKEKLCFSPVSDLYLLIENRNILNLAIKL